MGMQGRIQDFQVEGAQKILYAPRTSRAPESLKAGVQGLPRGPGSSRALDAFSYYLSLIFKNSDTKGNKKQHIRSKFRGGARLLRPSSWIRHWHVWHFATKKKKKKKHENVPCVSAWFVRYFFVAFS